jgi:hypothetical protein
MNRNIGGLFLTAAFVLTFVFSPPSHRPSAPPPAISLEGGETSAHVTAKPQDIDLSRTIQEFLAKPVDLSGKINSLDGGDIDVLIATVPDPVETHLSLFFDRTMDALQQGLIRDGYLFAGATLPWDSKQHVESADWRIREGQREFETARAEMPGLLIYRKPAPSGGLSPNPLFVLVVGETPTTGIHKDQFLQAVRYLHSWTGDSELKSSKRIRIIGPTFSGSLYSLLELLNAKSGLEKDELYLHSGTITGKLPVENFNKNKRLDNVHFASFQENDQYALQQFLAYVKKLGYPTLKEREPKERKLKQTFDRVRSCLCQYLRLVLKAKYDCVPEVEGEELPRISSVVLLTEDETAYGNSGEGVTPANSPPDRPERSLVTQLSFPRDISHLRSAYQQDLLKSEDFAEKHAPRTALPLNLEDIGGDRDTIPSYALRQTPLSQESVLFGIITDLKKLSPDFVVIRATNPLDELFLARFLMKTYPQVRVVTIGADLLFQQQKDDPELLGILAISPYSLRPDADRYLPPIVSSQSEHIGVLTFPSNFSAGVYNATLSLLACAAQPLSSTATCEEAPAAAYHEYGWSRELPANSDPETAFSAAQPALWLLVLGRDGYWPLARLNETPLKSKSSDVIARTLPVTTPSTLPKYIARRHLSKDWTRFGIFFSLGTILFCLLCAAGSGDSASQLLSSFDKTPDRCRAAILTFAAIILLLGLSGLLLPYLLVSGYDSHFLYGILFLALAPLVLCTSRTLHNRQAKPQFWFFFGVSVLVLLALISVPISRPAYVDQLELFRMQHIRSGVSPAVPAYFALAAVLCWCWSALRGQALLDYRCPQLPKETGDKDPNQPLPNFPVSDLTTRGNHILMRILYSPFSGLSDFIAAWIKNVWQAFRRNQPFRVKVQSLLQAPSCTDELSVSSFLALPVTAFLLLILALLDHRHPVYSLEGSFFDCAYAYLLTFVLFLLFTDLGRLVAGWMQLRRLLRALEQLPLRRSLTDIKEFSWRPIWRLGAIPQRALSREWESWRKYCLHRKKQDKNFAEVQFDESPAEINKQYEFFADRCPTVVTYLFDEWSKEDDLISRKDEKSSSAETKNKDAAEDVSLSASVRFAERFLCYMYTNFILTVLLRLRWFAVSAAAMYIFLVLSLTSYPFEPRLAIRSTLVLLLLAILLVVSSVYAQMHRDPTLSRITNTNAGELGADFWLRIVSFAALPVLGLLAAQFPEISNFLFSWIQPTLDALTK